MPRCLHLPSWPILRLRVAPYPALLSRAGDESSDHSESSVHQLCRRWIIGLPRISHPSALPVYVNLRASPVLHASLSAFDEFSGCPSFSSSGFAGDGSPSCLESRILRRCRLAILRVAPISGLSVSPMIRFPGCPESRIFRRRMMCIRITPDCAPSGFASGKSPGLPEFSLLWSRPLSELPGCPGSSLLWRRRPVPVSRFPRIQGPSAVPTC